MDPLGGSLLSILEDGAGLPLVLDRLDEDDVLCARVHDVPRRALRAAAARRAGSGEAVRGEAHCDGRRGGRVKRGAPRVGAWAERWSAKLGARLESEHIALLGVGWRARGAAVGADERLRVGCCHLHVSCTQRSFGGAAVGAGERLRVDFWHLPVCSRRRSSGGAAVGAGERLRVECWHLHWSSTRRSFGGAAVGAGERLRVGCWHL
eukprot:COSAG03_NODE_2916_length_2357_cov_214.760850_2_plen_207_part_00